MRTEERVYFRDLFRAARHQAYQDAEGFQQILFAIERMGAFRSGEIGDLGKYKGAIKTLADESSLCSEIPNSWRGYHIPFTELYGLVRNARNDALHQGAYARHLANHATQLALIIEDALMSTADLISDFMVHDVLQARPWQPISFARQQMLANSFSYLPIYRDGTWALLSDNAILRHIHLERKKRLAQSIEDAIADGLQLESVVCVDPDESVVEVIESFGDRPVLITQADRLLGMATAFDLL